MCCRIVRASSCDMCDVVQGHVAQDVRSHPFYTSLGLVRVFMIS